MYKTHCQVPWNVMFSCSCDPFPQHLIPSHLMATSASLMSTKTLPWLLSNFLLENRKHEILSDRNTRKADLSIVKLTSAHTAPWAALCTATSPCCWRAAAGRRAERRSRQQTPRTSSHAARRTGRGGGIPAWKTSCGQARRYLFKRYFGSAN